MHRCNVGSSVSDISKAEPLSAMRHSPHPLISGRGQSPHVPKVPLAKNLWPEVGGSPPIHPCGWSQSALRMRANCGASRRRVTEHSNAGSRRTETGLAPRVCCNFDTPPSKLIPDRNLTLFGGSGRSSVQIAAYFGLKYVRYLWLSG